MKSKYILGAVLILAVAAPAAAQMVDVNGSHIVVVSRTPRSWDGATIEVNGYWTFTVTTAAMLRRPTATIPARSMCINAAALTIKPSIRAGRNFDGVDLHFDPATMQVRTLTLDGVEWQVVTGGMKPLSQEAAARCIG